MRWSDHHGHLDAPPALLIALNSAMGAQSRSCLSVCLSLAMCFMWGLRHVPECSTPSGLEASHMERHRPCSTVYHQLLLASEGSIREGNFIAAPHMMAQVTRGIFLLSVSNVTVQSRSERGNPDLGFHISVDIRNPLSVHSWPHSSVGLFIATIQIMTRH